MDGWQILSADMLITQLSDGLFLSALALGVISYWTRSVRSARIAVLLVTAVMAVLGLLNGWSWIMHPFDTPLVWPADLGFAAVCGAVAVFERMAGVGDLYHQHVFRRVMLLAGAVSLTVVVYMLMAA